MVRADALRSAQVPDPPPQGRSPTDGLTPLADILAERIRADGPMPFAAFMQFALYHPRHGYYSAADRTGWRGHFLTSPELDPAFGRLWGRAFRDIWEACGRPERFDVVELGPGEGGFAEAMLSDARGGFGDALVYRLVEPTPALEARQRARLERFETVAWTRSIAELKSIEAGCIFANEVLDNQPVHVVENSDGLREICVAVEDSGLVEVPLRCPPELRDYVERVGVEVPPGHRFEVGLAAVSLVRRAAALIGRGALVFVDYGAEARDLAARRRGSVLCYSAAGVDDRPLERPGDKDITAHVNWTAVRAACEGSDLDVAGPRPQRDVLKALGLDALDDAARIEYASATGEGRGADAVAALSRRQALAALVDPGGLGRLEVLCATRDIEPPEALR